MKIYLLFMKVMLVGGNVYSLCGMSKGSATVVGVFANNLSLFVGFIGLIRNGCCTTKAKLLFYFACLFMTLDGFLGTDPVPFT